MVATPDLQPTGQTCLFFLNKEWEIDHTHKIIRILMWHSGLRIWSCHSSSPDHRCDSGSIPGPGTFTWLMPGVGQKKIFFFLFRATPVIYGSSQARSQTGAAAAGLCHTAASQDPSHVCDLYHSSRQWQHWILNPLSEARV